MNFSRKGTNFHENFTGITDFYLHVSGRVVGGGGRWLPVFGRFVEMFSDDPVEFGPAFESDDLAILSAGQALVAGFGREGRADGQTAQEEADPWATGILKTLINVRKIFEKFVQFVF